MKKIIIALLIFVFAAACFACGKNDLIRVVGADIDLSREISANAGEETKEIVIDSLTYKCRRVQEIRSPYYGCDADAYRYENENGYTVDCALNKSTGKVVSYRFALANGYETHSGGKTYEDCKKAALSAAQRVCPGGEFVFDEEKCTKEPEHTSDRGDVYTFTLIKTYRSKKTAVTATVEVNTDGWVCSCDTSNDPMFSYLIHPAVLFHKPGEDEADLRKKVRSLYGKDAVIKSVSEPCFAVLRDGTLGVFYGVELSGAETEKVTLFKALQNME